MSEPVFVDAPAWIAITNQKDRNHRKAARIFQRLHMKAMKLPKELQSLLEVAESADAETLVFTEKKRPVAALVSLRKVDREALALSTNPQFLRIIETSRREVQARKTTSLETIQRKFGVAVPEKPTPRRVKPRR